MEMSGEKSDTRREIRWVIAATVWALALAGCGSGDPSAEDLIGTWASSGGPTWEFTDADSISVFGGVAEGFTYAATSTSLELTEVGSEAPACEETGIYEWEIEEDVLTLTAVSDECEGRNDALDGITFEREE